MGFRFKAFWGDAAVVWLSGRSFFCSSSLLSIQIPLKVGIKFTHLWMPAKVGHCEGGLEADPGFAETLQQQLDQYSTLLSGTMHHPPLVDSHQPTGKHQKSKIFRNPLLVNASFYGQPQHIPVALYQVSDQDSNLNPESGKGCCDFVKSRKY